MKNPSPRLRLELESLKARYHRAEGLERDPLGLIDRTLAPADQEIVSFVVAGLSYGRAEQIRKSSSDLFRRVGERGIAERLARERDVSSVLEGWKHRLNTSDDLARLFARLGEILQTHGSLGRLFQKTWRENPTHHIEAFAAELTRDPAKSARGGPWTGTGLRWFAASPADGGSCKRLMMWLRWMIRKDDIDLGLWTAGSSLVDTALPPPQPARLFMPIDAHIFAWARKNKILSRTSPNWKSVVELTEFMRRANADDPVGYDFAICQAGMENFRATTGSP